MSTEPTDVLPEDAPLADAASTAATLSPRIRWAAIVWGMLFVLVAGTAIWMLGSASRRDGVTDWLASLNPGTIAALVLLGVGCLVLVTGLVGLIRRAQRRLAEDS